MNKTVKQYSENVDKQTLIELQLKASRTASLMNLVYSRFNGSKSYYLIHNFLPSYVRDKVLGKEICSQFDLLTRSSHDAIRDALGNLKSLWTNTFIQVKEQVKRRVRDNLFTEHESHYVYTVLKVKELAHCVLNRQKLDNFDFYSDKRKNIVLTLKVLQYKDINRKKLDNWIRKNIRKFKPSVPRIANARQSPVSDSFNRNGYALAIEGLKFRERPKIRLTDSRKLNPTRVVLNKGRVEVHNTCEIKVTKPDAENTVGIDKGFRCLIASSSGELYGKGFNELIVDQTKKRTEKSKKRNKLRSLDKKRELQEDIEKVKNIEANNLGDKKFFDTSRKARETVKNLINQFLNQFFTKEKPSDIVYEDLTKLKTKKGKFSKKVNSYLSTWQKGYLQERLAFKATQHGSGLTAVNPAYTSQICSNCGAFGKRNRDVFDCGCTGEVNADVNAAKNILARKYDSEIDLYTKYTRVKEILLARIELGKLDQVHYPWTPKTLETDVGDEMLLDYTVTQRANSNLGKLT